MNYPPYPLSSRARNVIFAVFTLLFFIISPTVTLYTAGYRFDFHSFRISKIGVLSVDILPNDAQVYLNDKHILQSIPMRISNLIPGSYHLRIEKDGYLPWIKDIVIEESKTTYIKNVTLFAIHNPEIIESNPTLLDIFPSRDGNFILEKFVTDDETKFVLFDTIQEISTVLPSSTVSADTIFWSENNTSIALITHVSNTIQTTVLQADDLKNNSTLSVKGTLQGYQWKQNFYNENLLLHIDNFLYKINPKDDAQGADNTHTSSSIFFREDGNNDWYFDNNKKTLVQIGNPKNNIFLPNENIKKIVDINNKRIILKTDIGLLIISRDEKQEIKSIATTNFFYDTERKEYIAWSEWELWTIYDNGQVALLNRMSEEIQDVAAFDKVGELLLVTKDKILGFNPGYYLTHQLISGVDVKKVSIDKKNKWIYFFGTWNNQKGIYRLKY